MQDVNERERLDADYSPSRLVDSIATYLTAYEADSDRVAQRYRDSGQLHFDLAYGDRPRERLHLITPQSPVAGEKYGTANALVVFIHGGFWKALSHHASLYAAPAWVDRGVAFAALGYTLAPQASLTQIVEQCYTGLDWLFDEVDRFGIDPQRIVLCGHSAGAHLAAMCVSREWGDRRIAGAMLVGGVFDLEPIARCYVNDTISLTPSEVVDLSPVRRRPLQEVPVSLVYGENETPAFKRQSEALAQAWRPHTAIVRCAQSPAYNHFDLAQQLGNPDHIIYQDLRAFIDRH